MDSIAQSTWGPNQTDYRRDLRRYQSNDVQSNGLAEINTEFFIGRESGPTIKRAVYQWDIPDNQIPDNSSIDFVRLIFSYDPMISGDFPAKFYKINFDMISSNYWDEIFDEMNYTVQDIGSATGENDEIIYESSNPNASINQAIRNMLTNNKFELGIKWANDTSPYDNQWGIYNAQLLLYIEFTPPTRLVEIDQRSSSNQQVGVLKKWEWDSEDWSNSFNPGSQFPFDVGSDQVILGDQTKISNEKYHNWNSLPDVTNHHSFNIDQQTNLLTSYFKPTESGVTIKNSLEGTSVTGGNIIFKDPWYIDYADQAFDGQLRNRGMDEAYPRERQSPFYPDYSTPFSNGSDPSHAYQGVFLDQGSPNWTPPYYSVQALTTQDINMGGRYGTRTFYFYKWSGSEINIQSPGNDLTGVVFADNNAEVKANLKGHFLSNSDVSYNSYQKNFHYLGSGIYTTVYESMGSIWDLSADNFNQWDPEFNVLDRMGISTGSAKNPYEYFSNDSLYLVFEYFDPADPSVSKICLTADLYPDHSFTLSPKVVDTYNSSFFGNAKPVVAAFGQGDQYEIVVLYKKDNTHGIYYKYYSLGTNGWTWQSGILSGTSSTSSNVSIAAEKNSTDHSLHICWEDQPSQIKYIHFYNDPNKRVSDLTILSSQCPLINHHRPSISITGKNNLIVSWSADNGSGIGKLTGTQLPAKRVVVRPRVGGSWGNFFISGSEVLNTYNNSSSSSSADESVIAWNENNNTTTKYVKRLNDGYCNSSLLSPNGIMPVISNGGSLADMKALVFNTESLPYIINKSDADFSIACGGGGGEIGKLSSITGENSVLYGRSGLIMVKGINFVFNTGDIVSGDSVVNFVTTTDTNQFQTAEELNEAMRTVDFELNSSSSLRFSNLYYVLNPELADSLSEDEAVSFRLELVNSATEEIMGVFDEITYNKNNLEKYENISYEINCSDIQQGNYYLRLVSEVSGEAEYNLGLIQNDVSEIAKKNYVNASYYGDKVPSTYEISQNYPNPFNPSTTINYQLPQTGFVTLKIYDILGKEVATLVNEQKNQGRYSVNFDASHLASGIYIYQLRVNNYVSSKKMLLLK